ncbi:MAG: hypothetical protein DMF57_10160 [Acidobacteria bacterium]|nr:MAG: hypothetical protein DMF57_10160 [Acidobacteriota bacterium]
MKNGSKFKRSLLTQGLLLIAIGAVFLLDQLRVIDFHETLRHYWPMMLVLFGVADLFQRRSAWRGLWMIAVGVWLQATVLHVFGLTFRNSWPLLLIVLGAGMTLRAFIDTVLAEPKEERRER